MGVEYLKIIIEHKEVDFATSDGFPISMVFSLDVVEDVTRLSGFYTKRGVLLPASDRVREVFGMFEELGIENDEDLNFKNFQIESNGLPVLWGRCRLRRVDMVGGSYFMVGKNYYVDFLGNNVTWFEDLKKLKLKDLGFGEHQFTEAVISSKINAVYAGGDFGYMPFKLREWSEGVKVMWNEFVPFLFIKSILREIFRNVGLEVVSEFFDYEPIERLVMPVFFQQNYSEEFFIENTNVRAVKLASEVVLPSTDVLLVFDDDSSGENFDNGGNYDNVTGEYSVPMAGRYEFVIKFSAAFTSVVAPCYMVLFVNGVETNAGLVGNSIFGELAEENIYSQVFNLQYTGVPFLVTWKLRVGASSSPLIEISNLIYTVKMKEVSTELGATVNFDYLLRDGWTADKFVLGLKQAFNLMFDTRAGEGKVYVEPMDRYLIRWKDSGGVVALIEGEGYFKVGDKNNKTMDVDLSKDMKLHSNENSFTDFYLEWESDDETVKGMDENENVELFAAKYSLNEERNRKGEKRERNVFFAKTLHLFDMLVMADDSVVVPQIPVLWPYNVLDADGAWLIDNDGDGDDESTSDYSYDLEFGRMLYFAGQRGGIDGRIVDADDNPMDLPFGFMVNYNDVDNGDFSLSFGNELKLDGSRVLGLMHNFYLSFLKRLDKGKRLEGYIYWSDLEIMALDFRRKILVNNVNFILREINGWNPESSGSVRTIMDADIIQEEGDELNIGNSGVEGFITEQN